MTIAIGPDGSVLYQGEDGQWTPTQKAQGPNGSMMALDGDKWKSIPSPAAAPDKSGLDYLKETVRSLAEGATMGWSQELYSKIDEARGLGKYDDLLKDKEAQDAQISSAIRIPGNVVGGVASTLATGGLGAEALGGTAIGKTLASAPNALKYPALGAIEGGITGAGMNPDDRLAGGAVGAGTGTVAGVAAPYVAKGVSAAWNAGKHALTPGAGQAARLGRALQDDSTTPQAILNRLQQARIDKPGEATIADVGGENVKGLVENVAQTPGPGRAMVVPRLEAKQAQQAGRVATDLRHLTGTDHSAVETINKVMADRTAMAKPLYESAMAFEEPLGSMRISHALGTETEQGWGKAVLNSTKLKRTLQTEYGIDSVENAPLMPLVDAWKKEVDDLVGAARRAGNSNQVRVLSSMKDRVIKVVDQANPDYAAARNAWSGTSQYLDAIEDGRGILNNSISAEEFAQTFRAMNGAQQEAYRTGAVSAIIARMENNTALRPDVTKMLRSSAMRQKIGVMMPGDVRGQAAREWQRRLDFEIGSSELSRTTLGGSPTARRLSQQDQAREVATDLVMDLVAGGGNISLLRYILKGSTWLRGALRQRANAELGDVLTNPRRANDLQGVLNQINPPAAQPVDWLTNSGLTAGATGAFTPQQ